MIRLNFDLRFYVLILLMLGFPFTSWCDPNNALSVREMTCEYTTNPIGIDTTHPRFNWILNSSYRGQHQTAYQIRVATDHENLTNENSELWDSGKVTSEDSVNIPWQGRELSSGQKCYWTVRVWDENNQVSDWSKISTFELGLLKKEDWEGKWIRTSKKLSSPLLRREFSVYKKIKSARAYMSGLGWSELYLNGKKVSDRILDPAMSYFDNNRYPELDSRVLYVTHDVTDYLSVGDNAVGVMLGNGWFSNDTEETKWRISYGESPILIFQLNITYIDGTTESIVSDENWKTISGPIQANDLCFGEVYDARLELPGWNGVNYDDYDWKSAVLAIPPNGKLVSQKLPAVKVMETIKPVQLIQNNAGNYVYDFGQNFSGWVKLRVKGKRGEKVQLRYAGFLNDDYSLNMENMWGETQIDSYILKGDGEEVWEPRFTLHGFRYVEVMQFPGTPSLNSLEGRFAYNDVDITGSFECSNPLFNQIHQNVCSTFKSSLQGIPQDAADRNERVAWLGDPGFVAEDYLYNFDTALFWSKWMDDIKDSQKENGDVPVVSPLSWSRDSWEPWPCWKSTYILIVWYLYQYYEDERIVDQHYDSISKLVKFLGTLATNHIIREGLGDHMEPNRKTGKSSFRPQRTPSSVTSTGIYYYDTYLLSQMAKLLGKMNDYYRYTKLAEEIKDAFNKEFLNTNSNQYSSGSQTSNAMALHFELVPEKRKAAVLRNLVENIMRQNEGHLATGIMGTNALEQVLGELGRADVMYSLTNKLTYPSWGYSISKGATTIWESFEGGTHSQNMKMFGSTEKYFYKDLAGITPLEPGFRKIRIKPQIVGDLTYAKASVKTVRGLIESHWIKEDTAFKLNVTIPVNSKAEVYLPKKQLKNVNVKENGQTVYKEGKLQYSMPGILTAKDMSKFIMFEIGSGSYAFDLSEN